MINLRLRKSFARVLLPFLTVWLCMLPARSYAVVPLVPVVIALADAAGAATAIDAGATAMASLLGAAFIWLGVHNSAGDMVRVPLTASNAVPAPSAPSSASQATSYFWQSTFCSLPATVHSGFSGQISAATDAASAINAACNYTGSNVIQACPVLGSGLFSTVANPSSCFQMPTTSVGVTAPTCPTGYVVSGSSCVLSDSRQVTRDKSTDYGRAGTTLSPVPDVDTASNPVKGGISNNSYVFGGTDSAGKPLLVVVTPTADGGSTVQIQKQGQDSAGNSVTTNSKVSVNPSGVVTSASQSQTSSSLSIDPGTQLGTAAATDNNIQNGTAPQVQPITFPSDYARTGEAAAAAAPISTKLDTIHRDLSDTVATTDPTVPIVDDMPTWGSSFTNLLGWRVPGHSSACPQPSMDLSPVLGSGHVYVMNSHCTLLNNNSAPIHNSMVAVFTVLALFLVLRA